MRTHRRTALLWVLAAIGISGAVVSFAGTPLPPLEQALGALFWGGLGLAALGMALQRLGLVGPGERARWAPRWCPRTAGGPAGVAVPVVRGERGLAPLGCSLIGAGLCAGAVYVGVTGRAVEGGPGARVAAIVVAAILGLILLLGGLAMRANPARAGSRDVLLTPDALYPALPGDGVPWTAVTGASARTVAPRGGRIGAATMRERVLVDVLGAGGVPLVALDVSARPDPDTVADLVTALAHLPSERGRLGTPAGVAWVADLARQAGAARR